MAIVRQVRAQDMTLQELIAAVRECRIDIGEYNNAQRVANYLEELVQLREYRKAVLYANQHVDHKFPF